jgi:hypothetical protein
VGSFVGLLGQPLAGQIKDVEVHAIPITESG